MSWLSGLGKMVGGAASGVSGVWPIIVGVPLIFGAGAWWDGDQRQQKAWEKVGKNYTGYAMLEMMKTNADEAFLQEEIVNGRATILAMNQQFAKIMDGSDQERAAFRAQLAAGEAAKREARDEAKATLKRLDDVGSQLAKAWLDHNIPADINCGVLHSPGCPKQADTPAVSPADSARRLSGEAAGAPGGGSASVPGRDAKHEPGDAGSAP